MGVFHTIAMFCTIGPLSLNNLSQNCHHLQASHSSCWQSFFFHLLTLCNLNHGLLITICRMPQYQPFNCAKKDCSRIQDPLFNPRATRGFQPFQNSHPPLSSRDPFLDLDRQSDSPTELSPPTFPDRPLLYQHLLYQHLLRQSFPHQAQLPDSNHPLRIFHHLVGFRNKRHQSIAQAVSRFEYRVITRPVQSSQTGTQLPFLVPPTRDTAVLTTLGISSCAIPIFFSRQASWT